MPKKKPARARFKVTNSGADKIGRLPATTIGRGTLLRIPALRWMAIARERPVGRCGQLFISISDEGRLMIIGLHDKSLDPIVALDPREAVYLSRWIATYYDTTGKGKHNA